MLDLMLLKSLLILCIKWIMGLKVGGNIFLLYFVNFCMVVIVIVFRFKI